LILKEKEGARGRDLTLHNARRGQGPGEIIMPSRKKKPFDGDSKSRRFVAGKKQTTSHFQRGGEKVGG